MIEKTFLDTSSRDRERKKNRVVLVDGDADQLALIDDAAKRYGVHWTIVRDVIHLIECLWKAVDVPRPLR